MDWQKFAKAVALSVNVHFFAPAGYILEALAKENYNEYKGFLDWTKEQDVNPYLFITNVKNKYKAYLGNIAEVQGKSSINIGNKNTAEKFSQLF